MKITNYFWRNILKIYKLIFFKISIHDLFCRFCQPDDNVCRIDILQNSSIGCSWNLYNTGTLVHLDWRRSTDFAAVNLAAGTLGGSILSQVLKVLSLASGTESFLKDILINGSGILWVMVTLNFSGTGEITRLHSGEMQTCAHVFE